MYNSFLKVVFIACSSAIVYIIRFKSPQKDTWNPELDNFPIQYLIGPCAVAGLLVNQDWTPFEMIWAFSIYLEAVAILHGWESSPASQGYSHQNNTGPHC